MCAQPISRVVPEPPPLGAPDDGDACLQRSGPSERVFQECEEHGVPYLVREPYLILHGPVPNSQCQSQKLSRMVQAETTTTHVPTFTSNAR